MKKQTILLAHTSHLDLYWFAAQDACLELARKIIDDAIDFALADKEFHFVIESVRFAEYYLLKNPDKADTFKKLIKTGQFEFAACYSDRNEHYHDGEAFVRNIEYGKRLLKKMLDYDSKFAFHPDTLGISEQTPQIHKKCGVPVYFQSRGGYGFGARFNWAALDGSSVIYYNFPGGYGGCDLVENIYANIDLIRANTGMQDVMVLEGASDCGRAGTSNGKVSDDGKRGRYPLGELLAYAQSKVPVEFKFVSPCATILSLDNSNLPTLSGEGPNRRGSTCSTTNVEFFKADKILSALLCDGEKLYAVAKCAGIDIAARMRDDFNGIFRRFRGGGAQRRYFDKLLFLDRGDDYTVNDLFDFGWRLHTTTHDHNFSGIEAAQTIFDREMFVRTAGEIAKSAIGASLAELSGRVEGNGGDILVFNTLNWKRNGFVTVGRELIDPSKNYAAVDGKGNKSPVVEVNGQYVFKSADVPSVGYKTYKLEKTRKTFGRPASEIKYINNKIFAANSFYSVTVDVKTGLLENITDLETGLSLSGNFMHARMYEDAITGSGDRSEDAVLIDDASEHVYSVRVSADNYYVTTLTVDTLLCNSHLRIDINLYNQEKRIDLKPVFYFAGTMRTRTVISLPFSTELKDITYGVPYGAQKNGNVLIPCSKEITEELYKRYRDIVYWMVLENKNKGFAISTTHNSVDIRENGMDAILIRNVKSNIDPSFCYTNHGEQAWNFSITSYKGDWVKNKVWRTSQEMLHPCYTAVLDGTGDGSLPAEKSFIDNGEAGVISVFKVSDYDSDAYTMRIYNPCSVAAPLAITDSVNGGKWECRNINETPCPDPADILGAYEIKTLVKKIIKYRRES